MLDRGLVVSTLSVDAGIVAMLTFYRDVRADDCAVEADGDMLLFQWGAGRERSPIDLTRQFITSGGEDDDIWQLSLGFYGASNDLGRGDRWCGSPDELDAFSSFVTAHPAYLATAASAPIVAELGFEPGG
ncbi:hypothetical protein BH11MYX1_BH11MYX1_38160 [soil metagenome]